MAPGDTSGGLTTRQKRTVAALLTSRTVEDAATAAKVSVRTVQRWLADDAAFRQALTEAEGAVLDAAVRRLVTLTDAAISVVVWAMADPGNAPGVRLRAAAEILSDAVRLREWRDLEARLAALEATVGKGS